MKKIKYPGTMDKPCIPICDAINNIPGLTTVDSCCGHSHESFMIGFSARSVNNLYALTRLVDKRYSSVPGWNVVVSDTDVCELPVLFYLHSGTNIGRRAYTQANAIAKSITKFLPHLKKIQRKIRMTRRAMGKHWGKVYHAI